MACITLLSDMGLQDASVAIARGILLQYDTGSPVIDISHEVLPFHKSESAYLLGCSFKNFPAGSCHLILLDLLLTQPVQLILTEYSGHYFLSAAPDIVHAALPDAGIKWLAAIVSTGDPYCQWLHEAGRLIRHLQTTTPAALKLQPLAPRQFPTLQLTNSNSNELSCGVMHVDNYGNVVTDLKKEVFLSFIGGRTFSLQFKHVEEISALSTDFGDVKDGFKLCRFNSNDYLEICVNHGKAANLFGLRPGSKNNEIKLVIA